MNDYQKLKKKNSFFFRCDNVQVCTLMMLEDYDAVSIGGGFLRFLREASKPLDPVLVSERSVASTSVHLQSPVHIIPPPL